MAPTVNEFGQPTGSALPDWQPRPRPERVTLQGRYCRLEPLDASRHASDLSAAHAHAADDSSWTWLPVERPASQHEWLTFAAACQHNPDYLHFAVIDLQRGQAVGTLALMRIEPQHGVMEVGYVVFSPLLQRTRMATEAHFLLMAYAFDQLGYRRYEWKCDSCNQPSRQAALRLGFQPEGVFRQAMVYKGRSRDTCWFSVIDGDWPVLKLAFERWLAPDNFSADGTQRERLETLRPRD